MLIAFNTVPIIVSPLQIVVKGSFPKQMKIAAWLGTDFTAAETMPQEELDATRLTSRFQHV